MAKAPAFIEEYPKQLKKETKNFAKQVIKEAAYIKSVYHISYFGLVGGYLKSIRNNLEEIENISNTIKTAFENVDIKDPDIKDP